MNNTCTHCNQVHTGYIAYDGGSFHCSHCGHYNDRSIRTRRQRQGHGQRQDREYLYNHCSRCDSTNCQNRLLDGGSFVCGDCGMWNDRSIGGSNRSTIHNIMGYPNESDFQGVKNNPNNLRCNRCSETNLEVSADGRAKRCLECRYIDNYV